VGCQEQLTAAVVVVVVPLHLLEALLLHLLEALLLHLLEALLLHLLEPLLELRSVPL
jgi:hypothetical protein